MSVNTLINGPINVVRLEGHVNNIKKIIYLFLDYHQNIHYQTKCPSFTSLDLYQYLAINLKNSSFPIDFMFEITQQNLSGLSYEYKDIYIREVVDFFRTEFYNDKSKNNNLIRYHFIDVRDYIFDTIFYYDHVLSDIFHYSNTNNNIHSHDVNNIKHYINLILHELDYWELLLFGDFKDINKLTKQNLERLSKDKQYDTKQVTENIKQVPNFIYKIRERYNNKQVRDNLQNIFDYIYDQFTQVIDLCTSIVNDLESNKDNFTNDFTLTYSKCLKIYVWKNLACDHIDLIKTIIKKYLILSHTILSLFSNIMDIYFLRRFLDKDYIQHAVVYTGAAHSVNYAQHLITKYNFKITHVSYSLEKDLTKLNEKLKKFDDTTDRREYEKNLYPVKLLQCSDLSHFPKNFE